MQDNLEGLEIVEGETSSEAVEAIREAVEEARERAAKAKVLRNLPSGATVDKRDVEVDGKFYVVYREGYFRHQRRAILAKVGRSKKMNPNRRKVRKKKYNEYTRNKVESSQGT